MFSHPEVRTEPHTLTFQPLAVLVRYFSRMCQGLKPVSNISIIISLCSSKKSSSAGSKKKILKQNWKDDIFYTNGMNCGMQSLKKIMPRLE